MQCWIFPRACAFYLGTDETLFGFQGGTKLTVIQIDD